MDFSSYPITTILIIINVVMFFISDRDKNLTDKTIMWPYYVKRNHQYYRLITSGFLHANFMHLFFNMFTLYFFGRNLELITKGFELGGSITYLGLYFGALVISDLPTYFKYQDAYGYRSLVASGAVSAVVFGMILFAPWSSIYLYGAIKISAAVYAVLFIAYCIYMGKKGEDNVNHDAHLWGALFGLAFMLIIIALKDPEIFKAVIEQLKHPSLLGRD